MNLTTSGNYNVNFTNSNTFYKLNHNNINNLNNYDTNNYKFLKDIIDIN